MAKDTSNIEYNLNEETGEINRLSKGKESVVATIDQDDFLEFETKYFDDKYRAEVVTFLTDDTMKRPPSGYGIKGGKRDVVSEKTPERPKESIKLGDLTPAVVDWYYKYKPNEFDIRYGVVKNEDGTRKTADVIRVEPIIDPETGAQGWVKDKQGNQHPRVREIEKFEQIIAKRATHITFLQSEVVGAAEEVFE